MKKLISLIVLCTTLLHQTFAQNPWQEYADRMNHIFQHVNKAAGADVHVRADVA